jgi:hypothetical protein
LQFGLWSIILKAGDHEMTESFGEKLVAALKKLDEFGDVAPPHVQDPTTMIIRQIAVQDDLMRWDSDRGHYVLTLTGRRRIAGRPNHSASVLRFRKRDEKDESGSRRKA